MLKTFDEWINESETTKTVETYNDLGEYFSDIEDICNVADYKDENPWTSSRYDDDAYKDYFPVGDSERTDTFCEEGNWYGVRPDYEIKFIDKTVEMIHGYEHFNTWTEYDDDEETEHSNDKTLDELINSTDSKTKDKIKNFTLILNAAKENIKTAEQLNKVLKLIVVDDKINEDFWKSLDKISKKQLSYEDVKHWNINLISSFQKSLTAEAAEKLRGKLNSHKFNL